MLTFCENYNKWQKGKTQLGNYGYSAIPTPKRVLIVTRNSHFLARSEYVGIEIKCIVESVFIGYMITNSRSFGRRNRFPCIHWSMKGATVALSGLNAV